MYIIIVGCGRVGAQLAKLLSEEGHNVVVVDKNIAAFDRVGQTFNGITQTGNGCNSDVLKKAGIEKADVFCALTDYDNTNIMASQIAKKIFKVPKVFARVYDPQRAAIYKTLGLDTVSGTVIFAEVIKDKIK
ncbi:MAG: TrkA family potassium uptake protein [Candidatus Omnitrophica bacterium]|nr:TrkA family potassium uptake protein [Candidatus Omnitrophota bacterium]